MHLKLKLYVLIEAVPRNTRSQRVFDTFLILLILSNVLTVILSSVNSLHPQYSDLFFSFEVISVAFFTLELVTRFWVSDRSAHGEKVSRRTFWSNPYNLIDIVATVPFYLSFVLNIDLRLLRLLRLFRVFKINPYFNSLHLLGSVIRQEFRPMLLAFSVIGILMLLAAAGIYLLEREGQPDTFGDLPSALWWVVVTLSTVGYGDAVPLTTLGRILGAMIMILGIGMVALPAGMLASRFSEVMHRQQELFRQFVEHEIETHGDISDQAVEHRRQQLFISRGEAKSVITNCFDQSKRKLNFCPNCGNKLPDHP